MNSLHLKKHILPHFISLTILLILSILLFMPALNGKKIVAGDIISSYAKTKHIKDYKAESGEKSYWNSAQFSGGPIYMLDLGQDNNLLSFFHKVATFNKSVPIGMFFAIGLSMYISLCLLRVNNWIALSLSISFMLSLVFFTLLEAGHNKKIYTITYLPLVISGVINLLKNNAYLKGAIALILGTSLAIYAGHVQMVYYLIIALIGFGLPLLVYAILYKKIKSFGIGFGLALLFAVVAAGTNYSQLYSAQNFSSETMRGGAILPKANDSLASTKKGLSWDYAMNWSYEVKDFLNIIVPRVVGGGSQEKVAKDNALAKLMISNGAQVKDNKVTIPGYWSSMPFTSGGAYIGALIFLFFIFSLLVLERDLAIAFVISFLLIFILSLGNHAAWFNRILFENAPLFDKFRAPSSAVSILSSFILIASALGLQKLIELKRDKQLTLKPIISTSIISVSILFVVYIIGSYSFSFLSANDLSYPFNIQEVLVEGRKSLFTDDILRTFSFVLVSLALLIAFLKNWIKSELVFAGLIAVFIIADQLMIDRRYLTEENYRSNNAYLAQFNPRPVDSQITKLEPNGRGYYRVLDLSVNTFNSATSAVHHNQIGGYDPTKLQRYQDIIDYHIAKNNMGVLNMLNTKYFISREQKLQTNPNAYGNAWFVSDIEYVNSNLDEINKLNEVDLKTTAVVFKEEFDNVKTGNAIGNIKLESYTPNRLTYKFESSENQFVVFSEIWYDGNTGWKAYIDGNEVDILRANYVLRALEVPSGKHEIVMEFKPQAKGKFVSLGSSVFALLIILGALLSKLGFINLNKREN